MSLEHAPGAKPLVCIGLNSIWEVNRGTSGVGWGGGIKSLFLAL